MLMEVLPNFPPKCPSLLLEDVAGFQHLLVLLCMAPNEPATGVAFRSRGGTAGMVEKDSPIFANPVDLELEKRDGAIACLCTKS
jgi:hypothetical protein